MYDLPIRHGNCSYRSSFISQKLPVPFGPVQHTPTATKHITTVVTRRVCVYVVVRFCTHITCRNIEKFFFSIFPVYTKSESEFLQKFCERAIDYFFARWFVRPLVLFVQQKQYTYTHKHTHKHLWCRRHKQWCVALSIPKHERGERVVLCCGWGWWCFFFLHTGEVHTKLFFSYCHFFMLWSCT